MYLVVYDSVFGICHESGRVFFTRASALVLATQRATEHSDVHDRVGIVRARLSIRDWLRFGWRHAWSRASENTIVWLAEPHNPDCICLHCTDEPIDLHGEF